MKMKFQTMNIGAYIQTSGFYQVRTTVFIGID